MASFLIKLNLLSILNFYTKEELRDRIISFHDAYKKI